MPQNKPKPNKPFYNAIAWRLGNIYVFGRLEGELSLNPGFTPDFCRLLVPRHEFAKLGMDNPDWISGRGPGALCFFFRNDPEPGGQHGTPDFELADWYLWDVEETRFGRANEGDPVGVLERRFTLADSRRKYRRGYGGLLTEGVYNPSRPDGKAELKSDGKPKFSLYDAIFVCTAGIPGFSSDNEIPTALQGVEAPRDLKWDGVQAAGELAKLLDFAGLTLVLKKDGKPKIVRIKTLADQPPPQPGAPAPPPPPITTPDSVMDDKDDVGTHELPFVEVSLPEDRPPIVIVTSAPTYAIEQVTLTGPDPDTIDYVGEDVDGSIKPLDQLTYSGGSAAALANKVADGFFGMSIAEAIAAHWSAFRLLKFNLKKSDDPQHPGTLIDNPNAGRLPILLRDVDRRQIYDDTGAAAQEVLLPPTLYAKTRIRTDSGWSNPDVLIRVQSTVVDPSIGLIHAEEFLGHVSPDHADAGFRGFTPLVNGELEFTFACEARGASPFDRFYFSAWRLTDNGIEQTPGIASAIADPEHVTLFMPELRLYRKDGVDINRADLDALARRAAESVLTKGTRVVSTRRYRGFHPFLPDGTISSVRFNQETLLTTVEVNRHRLPGTRYGDDAAARVLKAAVDKHDRSAGDDESRRIGTRDHAQPQQPRGPSFDAKEEFWAVLDATPTGSPPYSYASWHSARDRPQMDAGPRSSASDGPLFNTYEQTGILNPDGTSNGLTYPALKSGTRVRVLGYDGVTGKWYFNVALQPKRGPC